MIFSKRAKIWIGAFIGSLLVTLTASIVISLKTAGTLFGPVFHSPSALHHGVPGWKQNIYNSRVNILPETERSDVELLYGSPDVLDCKDNAWYSILNAKDTIPNIEGAAFVKIEFIRDRSRRVFVIELAKPTWFNWSGMKVHETLWRY